MDKKEARKNLLLGNAVNIKAQSYIMPVLIIFVWIFADNSISSRINVTVILMLIWGFSSLVPRFLEKKALKEEAEQAAKDADPIIRMGRSS